MTRCCRRSAGRAERPAARASRSEHRHLRSRHDVFATTRTAALCRQAAPRIAIVVEPDYRDLLADEKSVARYGNVVLEGCRNAQSCSSSPHASTVISSMSSSRATGFKPLRDGTPNLGFYLAKG